MAVIFCRVSGSQFRLKENLSGYLCLFLFYGPPDYPHSNVFTGQTSQPKPLFLRATIDRLVSTPYVNNMAIKAISIFQSIQGRPSQPRKIEVILYVVAAIFYFFQGMNFLSCVKGTEPRI
jgi:hypothetical protein